MKWDIICLDTTIVLIEKKRTNVNKNKWTYLLCILQLIGSFDYISFIFYFFLFYRYLYRYTCVYYIGTHLSPLYLYTSRKLIVKKM